MFLGSRDGHYLGSLLYGGDRDSPQSWTPTVQIPATLVHGVAILTTIFRLIYRWYLSRISWEDGWATLALICDAACLASVWIKVAPVTPHTGSQINIKSNWLFSLTITAIVWFARISILSSIVRIANPTPRLRLAAYCIGAMFLAMEAGLLAQKIFFCVEDFCKISYADSVPIAQLVTDIISDIILVAVPIRFLRDARLHRNHRILIISTFAASILISGVTILHSVLLFQDSTDTTLIIGHIKAALALFVCNALVLVTFVYRLCRTSGFDPEYPIVQDSGIDAVFPTASGEQCTGDAADTKAPASDTLLASE
ncbi:hypothetical protein OG21DRAFT_560838 [Imleria badia]|nr:hypothetical protein OG21DRAFT_560838 [Imleria badia]